MPNSVTVPNSFEHRKYGLFALFMMERYYQLWTSTTKPIDPVVPWSKGFREKLACPACGELFSDVTSVDVLVKGITPGVDFSFVYGVLVDIIRARLLAELGPDINEHLFLGKVATMAADLPGFRTIRCKHKTIIRGGPRSEYRKCDQCSRPVYTPIGDYYLLASGLAGKPICQAHVGFVVNEEIYQRISSRKWKDLHLDDLPIVDEPVDGYPAEL